ncbi:ice-binding family protein [Marisediminicola sp. LYQ85]|uniref:ice-binding family protein n=1 Tax=Marisediminicola sp. LYQ85 TaxID=3391062 RepID=UPI0039834636
MGPIDLGGAEDFGVLASSEITNTGPTVVAGDVGVAPGTSITGFEGAPAGSTSAGGVIQPTGEITTTAQTNLDAAITDAESLTPTADIGPNISGLSLTPGVYDGGGGGELLIDAGAAVTLAGTAESIWVFRSSSSLTVGAGAEIILTGGASACNVFWQVDSAATFGEGVDFTGTVMARAEITLGDDTSVEGRLLSADAAVTLINNDITVPEGCAEGTSPVITTAPVFTDATPPPATEGTPYSYTFDTTSTPDATYSVVDGELPAGLELDETTGELSGTPTTPGTVEFTVEADNGFDTPTTVDVTIVTAEAPEDGDGTGGGGDGDGTGGGGDGTGGGGDGTDGGGDGTDGGDAGTGGGTDEIPGTVTGPNGALLANTGADTQLGAIGAGVLLMGAMLTVASVIARRRGLTD